jgi:hypothetical protein
MTEAPQALPAGACNSTRLTPLVKRHSRSGSPGGADSAVAE